MTVSSESRHSFADETLWGVGILICLVAYGTLRYPESVEQGGISLLILAGAFLAAYCAAAMWNRQIHTGPISSGLVAGAAIGICVGVLEIGNISLETSSIVSRDVSSIAPPLTMALMAMLFGGAGSIAYQRTSSLRLAVWSGIWCALIGSTLTCIFGFAYNLGFMKHMEGITQVAFAQSGFADPRAFVVRKTLQDMSSHLMFAPILAAIFSCSGALLRAYLRYGCKQRRLFVSVWCAAQLIVGVLSIRWALALARGQRPPFILFGMLASGLALSWVLSIISAWRQGNKSLAQSVA